MKKRSFLHAFSTVLVSMALPLGYGTVRGETMTSQNTAKGASVEGPLALSASAGLRQSSFSAAPETQALWTMEFQPAAHYRVWDSLPLLLGARTSLSQMRGSLGSGLETFSGYQFGPEALGFYQFANLPTRLHLRANYLMGRMTGKGRLAWDQREVVSLYALGAEMAETVTKKFRTSGFHVALGGSYAIASSMRLLAEYDIGFETLTADDPVYFYGKELADRQKTSHNSRGFLMGATLAL